MSMPAANGPENDLRHRIALEATHALLDLPARELTSMAHYDVLMAALPGWQRRAMLDLTKVAAKDPFAWFLFEHPQRGWWVAHWVDSACLSHPFDGKYIQTNLVNAGALIAGETVDEFVEAAYAFATAPRFRGGQMSDPDAGEVIHAQWALGHFKTEKAAAYQMLLGLTAGSR